MKNYRVNIKYSVPSIEGVDWSWLIRHQPQFSVHRDC